MEIISTRLGNNVDVTAAELAVLNDTGANSTAAASTVSNGMGNVNRARLPEAFRPNASVARTPSMVNELVRDEPPRQLIEPDWSPPSPVRPMLTRGSIRITSRICRVVDGMFVISAREKVELGPDATVTTEICDAVTVISSIAASAAVNPTVKLDVPARSTYRSVMTMSSLTPPSMRTVYGPPAPMLRK